MYDPSNVNIESVGPGIREYNLHSRGNRTFVSGLGRPICCFTFLGVMLTGTGTTVFLLARNIESADYEPFRTFGSTFIAIGLLVLCISVFLLCEAMITGRFVKDPDSTRNSREDLRSNFGRENRVSFNRTDFRASLNQAVVSIASMSSSRTASVIDDVADDEEIDSQPLLINHGTSDQVQAYQTFRTFPYPIPILKVHTESGETIPSNSV